jgi:VanZ family protein
MRPILQRHSESHRSTRLFRLALVVALISGTTVALLGGKANDVTQLMGDKLVHFLGAALLGLLLDYSFPGPHSHYWRWQAPLLLTYSILIEIAQGFSPHRVADIYDVVANAAGLIAYGGFRSLFGSLRQPCESNE